MKITILHLYPDLLNLYGDRGNIITLTRRLQWRGIQVEIREASLKDHVDFTAVDLVFIGGGSDKEQNLLFQDLKEQKGPALKEAVEEGLPLLSICGGYQLLGLYYKTHQGETMPGLGLFNAWTVAGGKRLIGNVVIRSPHLPSPGTVVGFENHSGQTFLGDGPIGPLGEVVQGFGNNGKDKGEGALYKNAIGTYLHGPLLPKNPALADWLLQRAVERKYPGERLQPLPDHLERLAHDAAVRRFAKK